MLGRYEENAYFCPNDESCGHSRCFSGGVSGSDHGTMVATVFLI